jgi:RNA 3'-terminal phosphate cyclase-like protein
MPPCAKRPSVAATHILEFEGSNFLRQRLVLSLLSSRPIRIQNIRAKAQNPGLQDFEANLLKMIDVITNGTKIEVNKTGTKLFFVPGMLHGGTFKHVCNTVRGIGYYLELLLCVAPFSKQPTHVTLTGVTNTHTDPSPDMLKYSVLPLLKRYYISEGLEIKVLSRGMHPGGGGEVLFTCPVKRSLKSMQWRSPGRVKRIRGIAHASRVSPATAVRLLEAAKANLQQFISDVYIYADHRKAPNAGNSPGFGLTLVAETTEEVYYTAEMCSNVVGPGIKEEPSVPEDLGSATTQLLFQQIYNGGCVDELCQPFAILFMTLCPTDVCKLLVGGHLTQYSIEYLRHIKQFFGIQFKFDSIEAENEGCGAPSKHLLTCVGSGFTNLNKVTL